jgi:hypothetical protein
MAMPDLEQLRYPVGRFARLSAPLDAASRRACIDTIEQAPARFRALVTGRSEGELDTPYRPDGWTVRQVVHHVPDSHLNAYVRMKLALTEETPTIKPYDEQKWSELPDAAMPVDVSLSLLDAVHARWLTLFRAMKPGDFARTFNHPEYPQGPRTLDWMLQQYAWHSRHHVAHITSLRQRSGW